MQNTPAYPPTYDAAMSGQVGAPVYVDSKPQPGAPPMVAPAPYQPAPSPYQPAPAPYQPAPSPYQQQPQPVVTQVQYVGGSAYGPNPVTITCPHCGKHITSRTSSEPSATAWIFGFVLCIFGCIPCCVIPCCIDSMKEVTHSCPSCNTTLGRYKGGGL